MDQRVLDIAEAPLDDADQIPGRFHDLCAALPEEDGVRRFCQVHEVMSKQVNAHLENHGFEDQEGLELIDIKLVQRFLTNVAAWERDPDSVGKAWAPLFERRANRKLGGIRFALAGIYAHVASDLVWAILETHKSLGRRIELDSPLHKDYCYVNEIEGRLRDSVEEALGSETYRNWDEKLGLLDDKLRSWSFARARDKAWTDAMLIDFAPDILQGSSLRVLDQATGFTNRMILH